MDEDWKNKLPLIYVPVTKCYNVVNKLQDPCVDIVICTDRGQLLEFSNKRILGACYIQICNAETITCFVSYEPVLRYYIIKSGTMLTIVAKKVLQVVREFQNVETYFIKDFLNAGSPQVGIWLVGSTNSSPDIVTDFTDRAQNEAPLINEAFLQVYHEKLQEIKLRVAECEEELKAKRKCRKISSYIFSENQQKKLSHLEPQLVCMVGQENIVGTTGPPLEQQQHQQKPPPIEIIGFWQRMYHGSWILGVKVHNAGERCITDLNLVLKYRNGQPMNYTMQILAWGVNPAERDASRRTWQNVSSLPESTNAVIMGILKQPEFLGNPVVDVSGVITYKIQDSSESAGLQLQIPCFCLNAEEFSMKSMVPFTQNEIGEADLVSVLVASEHVVLSTSNVRRPLQTLLKVELGFETMDLETVFHKGRLRPGLAGIMICIKDTAQHMYSMDIYARDVPHVFLLVHCLYAALPMDSNIALLAPATTPVTARMICDSLSSEIDLVASKYVEWTEQYSVTEDTDGKSRSFIKVPRDMFSNFQKQLSELEMYTNLLSLQGF